MSATYRLTVGEKQLISYSEERLEEVTISDTVLAQFYLYNDSGSLLGGYPIAVSGYDSQTSKEISIWHNLDTTGLVAGNYVGLFKFGILGNQGIISTLRKTVEIAIVGEVDFVATYDISNPTSNKDKVRRHTSDTNTRQAIWADSEINAYLEENSSNPYLASASMLEDASVDAARQAKIIRLGDSSWDRTRIAQQLLESAKRLREQAPFTVPTPTAPNAIFTLTKGDCIGSMENW